MTESDSLFHSLFSLDPEQKEMLIEVIEKLLKDKSTVSNTIDFRKTDFVDFISQDICQNCLNILGVKFQKLILKVAVEVGRLYNFV